MNSLIVADVSNSLATSETSEDLVQVLGSVGSMPGWMDDLLGPDLSPTAKAAVLAALHHSTLL